MQTWSSFFSTMAKCSRELREGTMMWGLAGIVVNSQPKFALVYSREIAGVVILQKSEIANAKERPHRAQIVTTVGKWLTFDVVFENGKWEGKRAASITPLMPFSVVSDGGSHLPIVPRVRDLALGLFDPRGYLQIWSSKLGLIPCWIDLETEDGPEQPEPVTSCVRLVEFEAEWSDRNTRNSNGCWLVVTVRLAKHTPGKEAVSFPELRCFQVEIFPSALAAHRLLIIDQQDGDFEGKSLPISSRDFDRCLFSARSHMDLVSGERKLGLISFDLFGHPVVTHIFSNAFDTQLIHFGPHPNRFFQDLEESSDEDYFSESQSENGHLNILKEEARSFPTRSSTHISADVSVNELHWKGRGISSTFRKSFVRMGAEKK